MRLVKFFSLLAYAVTSLVSGGLLRVGKPIPWKNALPHLHYVREHGIQQFINRYQSVKDIRNDELKWGDEIEYALLKVDHTNKKIRVSLRASDVRDTLNELEQSHSYRSEGCTWHPEYGAWMLEGTPREPFRGFTTDLLRVETSMRLRRARLLSALNSNEISPTVTLFPRFGVGSDFCDPIVSSPNGEVAASQYLSDEVINPHPRFAALTANIRARRGSNVDIKVPLYRDGCTPEFLQNDDMLGEKKPFIHMDAMAFGMGCCCLQLTFQARDVAESRYMYDQLAVLSPIMLALSAATPIFRGRLADMDVRWNVISASVDDRTPEERGIKVVDSKGESRMAGNGQKLLPKSRYASISTFIHHCKSGANGEDCRAWNLRNYNDIDCPIDEGSYEALLNAGIDEAMARHVAHLFTRDPLVVFEGRIEELDDEKEAEHFENIQSTNWQTVRWKPPPPRTGPNDPHIGWRTEFRSLEIQLTDFENAAFVVFVVLVTRVILAFDLCLYVPLSKVDLNMERAHERDAVLNQKFFYRSCIDPHESGRDSQQKGMDSYEEMTISEILMGKVCDRNGSVHHYPGLIPLVYAYLEYIGTDTRTFERIEAYLELLRARAAGEVMTTAAWMRRFVSRHPEYNGDSIISDRVCYDLMMACKDIGEGRVTAKDLIGSEEIEPVTPEGAFDVPLASARIDVKTRRDLIDRYARNIRSSEERLNYNTEMSSSNFSSTFEQYDRPDCEPFIWGL